MPILSKALLTGGALVLASIILYFAAPNGSELSGYAIAPGVFVGLITSVLISGNPHVVSEAVMVITASAVNFVLFTGVSYIILRLVAGRLKKNNGP
jgi:hypothetical protein